MEATLKIALVGNPNIGKTTLFNHLSGLSQKTGNFPGVTVERKKGKFKHLNKTIEVVDLPGIHSLYPKSEDENVVFRFLTNIKDEDFPDKIVVVVSAINLKKNLYLFHQIQDLEIPVILVINMCDIAEKRGYEINIEELEKNIQCKVIKISAKTGKGIDDLKNEIVEGVKSIHQISVSDFSVDLNQKDLENFQETNQLSNLYSSFLELTQNITIPKKTTEHFLQNHQLTPQKLRTNESILRYRKINTYLNDVLKIDKTKAVDKTTKMDKVLLHPIWGYVLFFSIMFVIFQSIFVLASYPMDWIDQGFAFISEKLKLHLPDGYFFDLITDGLIPGIGGIVIFIPQIAILFLFFSFIEESGYMSRIVFLVDRFMQKFGMSGKSIVPLISGFACAVPSIMSARTIENKKERLITILITPLLTCSARIPVYVVLISLIIPNEYFGIISYQGLAMFGMYLIGMMAALTSAIVFKKILKSEFKSTLLLEMPQYLWPNFKNIFIRVWSNSKSFVVNAGKIIIATSIVLFVLATNGGDNFKNAEKIVSENSKAENKESLEQEIATYQLENSYLGNIGKAIEPSIRPLGYDWKIGIAIITSLAAREVFVGTISTIYNINSDEYLTIKNKLANEVNPKTGLPVFSLATSFSLLLFYAFALQCFSTVATTYKETQSLKWTLVQFFYMGIFAYLISLIAFQILK